MAPAAPAKAVLRWDAISPPLSPWVLNALSTWGLVKPTMVQQQAISLFMGNKDVIVEAVTGSGKTLAFLIPVIERLLNRDPEACKKHQVGAIVIAPTRELAQQIYEVAQKLLGYYDPSSSSSKAPAVVPQLLTRDQDRTVKQDLSSFLKDSTNLLIGTPGRLVELLQSKHVHCVQSSFEMLVLDEADRLLDRNYEDDMNKILRLLPKQRRTGVFSASATEALNQMHRLGLRNPYSIKIKVHGKVDKRTPASLSIKYVVTEANKKIQALEQLLQGCQPPPDKVIVFFATRAAVDYFALVLPKVFGANSGSNFKGSFSYFSLHGDMHEHKREGQYSAFKNSPRAILFTTDVAGRGLDIEGVDLVVQMEPPTDPKTFIHRCGRAGRAGRRGLAVTFLTPSEEAYVNFLETRETPLEPLENPSIHVSEEDAQSTCKKIQDIVLMDRMLHDKAMRGFVSWVQFYRKHQASAIFRIKDIDWVQHASFWGLLQFPKMPELAGLKREIRPVDWAAYRYKDKQAEANRLRMDKEREEGTFERKPRKKEEAVAWSEKKAAKEEREARRAKKVAKRLATASDEQKAKQKEIDDMVEKVRESGYVVESEEEFNGFSD